VSAPVEDWDQDFADTLEGAIVLVGLSYCDPSGSLLRREQFFGQVQKAERTTGILLSLGGLRSGEMYNLPPMTSALQAAAAGLYTLSDTGEAVEDPDFVTTWTVTAPHS
jgi:hypothetical protein